jgi:hypothetical protein
MAEATSNDLSIHSENQYASGIVKRPRGPRATLNTALQVDLQTRSWTFYLNHYLYKPNDLELEGSVQDSVCQWACATNDATIKLAISSMALAIFSRVYRHPPAAAKACERYDMLLRSARSVMPALVQSDIDAALLAVFLMARYEDSMHVLDPSATLVSAFKSFSHHDGSSAILKVWYEQSASKGQSATSIIKHSRRGIIRSSILRHQAVPSWLRDGAVFGEYGPELEYDRVQVQLAGLRQRLRLLQEAIAVAGGDGLSDLIPQAQDMYEEITELNSSWQAWIARVPDSWCAKRHLFPSHIALPKEHFYSSVVYSYPSLGHTTMWLTYYAMSMLLGRARLRILEAARCVSEDFPLDLGEEDCCRQIDSMAAMLALSVPFALGKFSVIDPSPPAKEEALTLTLNDDTIRPYLASLVAWPVSVASSIVGLDSEQRNWLKLQLTAVGRAGGIAIFEDPRVADVFDL